MSTLYTPQNFHGTHKIGGFVDVSPFSGQGGIFRFQPFVFRAVSFFFFRTNLGLPNRTRRRGILVNILFRKMHPRESDTRRLLQNDFWLPLIVMNELRWVVACCSDILYLCAVNVQRSETMSDLFRGRLSQLKR